MYSDATSGLGISSPDAGNEDFPSDAQDKISRFRNAFKGPSGTTPDSVTGETPRKTPNKGKGRCYDVDSLDYGYEPSTTPRKKLHSKRSPLRLEEKRSKQEMKEADKRMKENIKERKALDKEQARFDKEIEIRAKRREKIRAKVLSKQKAPWYKRISCF